MITLRILSSEDKEKIHQKTLEVLENTGIEVRNDEGVHVLKRAGCEIEENTARISSSLVEECIKKAPSSFELFTREGFKAITIGSDNVVFNPGSSAASIRDRRTGVIRKGTLSDVVELVKVVDRLENLKAQSTALIPSDVPEVSSDFYRLYLSLKYSSKPIITGAFRREGIGDMKNLLDAVVGGEEELSRKPLAVFDCCPLSPLVWSDISCQNLIDCANASIPSQIVPAPLMGATSPVTLSGTIVQTNVEILSGIVISQLVNPGTPVVYGGAPAVFDMKYATPRFSAMESILTACASSELGRHYGLPTNAYLGVSESKVEDAQSGYETTLGLTLGVLSRVNVISGPGMLAFLNCQSLEKLVIDNELCGSALRLLRGVNLEDIGDIVDLIGAVGPTGNYLGQKHTSKRFRTEHFMPSDLISRLTEVIWSEKGSKSIHDRAKERVSSILQDYSQDAQVKSVELEETFKQLMEKYRSQPNSR